ncbi:hypothetical protein AKJ09_08673 [Labilithrix luteola]|uniref:Lipoprotein n=1 Tax=Labilithrix luteola TaxID=1391654 RepID=A0A0K1Q9A7_9BACT|nr:hypothetical protein [Labilithrix luteola]AKV02010.1 hypothetical protein AKJ09_08673 [Labilithrix luteola]
MQHESRHRPNAYAVIALASLLTSAALTATACTNDNDGSTPVGTQEPTTPAADSGTGKSDAKAPDAGDASVTDAAADAADSATEDPDACADGGCEPKTGCAAIPGAAFCDDFDKDDALDSGKTKWDFLEPTSQPVLALSKARAVSQPNSLQSQIIDGTTPGAKFAKTVQKADFTEATWSYDVFFENVGTTDGYFLDDFQFTDAAGPDTFGFRVVMFADNASIGQFKIEHNQTANGGDYVIEDPMPAGTVLLGKWHHIEQTAKFAFANTAADASSTDTVQFTLSVDGNVAFQKSYPGITRAQATFARIAGMPLVFNKANSAGLKIFWDNHAVVLK